jgi:hypothetical protein
MDRIGTTGFRLVLAAVVGLAPCAVVLAQAQDAPAVTVAGGLVRVVDEDVTLDGFFVEGERQISRRFSIVGQVHRATTSNGSSFPTFDWTDLFDGSGVRFTMRPHRVVQPHVHALAG